MINNEIISDEKALIIGVIQPGINDRIISEQLDELELLAKTAGAKVLGRITQKISKINPATFIGKGKAEQILKKAKELDSKLILFDDELSPAQIKNYHHL